MAPREGSEEELLMIEMWCVRTYLYQTNITKYKNKEAKISAFEKIGRNFDMAGDDVKNRFRSMRTTFTRATHRRPTGSAAIAYTPREVFLLANLDFLQPFIQERASKSTPMPPTVRKINLRRGNIFV